jgi:hypothetical protein
MKELLELYQSAAADGLVKSRNEKKTFFNCIRWWTAHRNGLWFYEFYFHLWGLI